MYVYTYIHTYIYSNFLLYWYKSTNTDAEEIQIPLEAPKAPGGDVDPKDPNGKLPAPEEPPKPPGSFR
jgi:hypothetical protein